MAGRSAGGVAYSESRLPSSEPPLSPRRALQSGSERHVIADVERSGEFRFQRRAQAIGIAIVEVQVADLTTRAHLFMYQCRCTSGRRCSC